MQKKKLISTDDIDPKSLNSANNPKLDEIDEDQLIESLDRFGAVAGNLQNIIQSLSSTVERLEGKLHQLERRIEDTEKKPEE